MAGRTTTSPQAVKWKREFGERVRELRLEAGLSQEQLAHKAEVHRTYIGSVERGEQNASLVLIYMIALALEVDVTKLFEGPV